MTFNGLFVYKKLNKIEEYLKFTDKEIFDDSMKMHIGERLFQLIIDEILDINQHFIGELDLKLTEDFQGTFDALADNKIISKEFSNKISGVVNLRNIIVHDYEKFDKKLFLKDLRKNYSDFKKYIKFIVKFLEK